MRNSIIVGVLLLFVLQANASFADPTLRLTEERRGQWFFTGILEPPVVIDDQVGCEAIPWVFEWSAEPDADRTIDAYRHGWDITDFADDSQWSPWSGDLSTPPRSFFFGVHTFSVEVRDDLGTVTRGTIHINVIPVTDPTLEITDLTRGTWVFVGPDSPGVIVTDILADPVVPWDMSWRAYTCIPEVSIDAYRYGWDISDPLDDSQWSPWGSDTSAPRQSFYFGTHSFSVEVRTDTGVITRGTVRINVIQEPVPVKASTWGQLKWIYRE